MDLETANRLPEGAPVRHKNRGPAVWFGVDTWDKTSCWVGFPGEQEARVSLDLVEVR